MHVFRGMNRFLPKPLPRPPPTIPPYVKSCSVRADQANALALACRKLFDASQPVADYILPFSSINYKMLSWTGVPPSSNVIKPVAAVQTCTTVCNILSTSGHRPTDHHPTDLPGKLHMLVVINPQPYEGCDSVCACVCFVCVLCVCVSMCLDSQDGFMFSWGKQMLSHCQARCTMCHLDTLPDVSFSKPSLTGQLLGQLALQAWLAWGCSRP